MYVKLSCCCSRLRRRHDDINCIAHSYFISLRGGGAAALLMMVYVFIRLNNFWMSFGAFRRGGLIFCGYLVYFYNINILNGTIIDETIFNLLSSRTRIKYSTLSSFSKLFPTPSCFFLGSLTKFQWWMPP